MRFRLFLVALTCALGALAVPLTASAAQRMLVGFQDDPSLRWRDDRAKVFDLAEQAGAGILRTTVYWSRVAETKPKNAANPFDPAYRFDDLDEFVRNAGQHGAEVMLTIWGTPTWANGGKGQNYAPNKASDLRKFARAVAARYSGRYGGYPFVRYFTVWNESNLGQFLSPQYNAKGKPVAAAIYARLYRAAYAGIKSGNSKALVAIGETSARGRDRVTTKQGQQQTQSPGKFAELLSKQRPKLKFDAWSQHPYPTTPSARPTQRVRWPNVTLSMLQRFGQALDGWFKRKNIPIWITEYGYETKPGEPRGVTYAQQANYARQALTIARKDPRVKMFIWFILRDDPTSTWQSGLVRRNGAKKRAFATFSAIAHAVDARNPMIEIQGGVTNPIVRLPALELWARSGTGALVGINLRVYSAGQQVGVSQPQVRISYDGWLTFPVPLTTAKGRTYKIIAQANDANGNTISRTITIVSK